MGGVCKAPASACGGGMQPAGQMICSPNGQWQGETLHCEPQRCNGIPAVNHSADLAACVGAFSDTPCLLSCLPGYYRKRDPICRNGTWTSGLCEKSRCMHRPLIKNGKADVFKCSSLALGMTCPLKCDVGYVQQGTLRCLGTILSGASCVPAPCADAPNVDFASNQSVCAGAPSGAVCSIQCQSGFKKTGDAFCSFGKWSYARCDPAPCDKPPNIAQAREGYKTACIGTSSGEPCRDLKCNDGYTKSNELLCFKGVFNTPKCLPSSCKMMPDMRVPHAVQGDCTSYGLLVVCSITCTGARIKTGDMMCAGGRWWLPRCLPVWQNSSKASPGFREVVVLEAAMKIDQDEVVRDFLSTTAKLAIGIGEIAGIDPRRVHARQSIALAIGNRTAFTLEIAPPLAKTAAEKRAARSAARLGKPQNPAVFASAAAKKLESSAERLAPYMDAPQSFISVKTLMRVAGAPCMTAPQISHSIGLDSCAPALSGSVCDLRCTEGYQKTMDLACADGDWLGASSARCEPRPCLTAPPIVAHSANMSACRGYTSGSACPLQCQPGFQPTNDIICNFGRWSKAACTPQPCVSTPVLSGSAQLQECAGMPSGRRCQPLCLAGRALNNFSLGILCSKGNWQYGRQYQSLPACKSTGCPSVPAVLHARSLDHCAGTALGQQCEFSCEGGFEPVGKLFCIQGQWTRPTCAAKKCNNLPVVGNTMLQRCVGTASGRTCSVFCPVGQTKTADLFCLNGEWQNERLVSCTTDPKGGLPCQGAPIVRHADAER